MLKNELKIGLTLLKYDSQNTKKENALKRVF